MLPSQSGRGCSRRGQGPSGNFVLFYGYKLGNVVPHGDGGVPGRLLEVVAVAAGLLPGAHNAAGGVDDGAVALLVEGVLYVSRSAALSAVAGHQEEGVGQTGPEILNLLGIGGTGRRQSVR